LFTTDGCKLNFVSILSSWPYLNNVVNDNDDDDDDDICREIRILLVCGNVNQ